MISVKSLTPHFILKSCVCNPSQVKLRIDLENNNELAYMRMLNSLSNLKQLAELYLCINEKNYEILKLDDFHNPVSLQSVKVAI